MKFQASRIAACLLLTFLAAHATDSSHKKDACENDRCSGIVSSYDESSNQLTLRVKSPDDSSKELTHTFRLPADTVISKADGKKGSLSDLKSGTVVTYSPPERSHGWSAKQGKERPGSVVMRSACTADTCAKSSCNRDCKSAGCNCVRY